MKYHRYIRILRNQIPDLGEFLFEIRCPYVAYLITPCSCTNMGPINELMVLGQLVWMLLGMVLQELCGLHSRAAHDGELVCSLSPALLLFLSGQFGILFDGAGLCRGCWASRASAAEDDVVEEALPQGLYQKLSAALKKRKLRGPTTFELDCQSPSSGLTINHHQTHQPRSCPSLQEILGQEGPSLNVLFTIR